MTLTREELTAIKGEVFADPQKLDLDWQGFCEIIDQAARVSELERELEAARALIEHIDQHEPIDVRCDDALCDFSTHVLARAYDAARTGNE